MELRLKHNTQTGIIFGLALALLFGFFSLFVIQVDFPVNEIQKNIVPKETWEKECQNVPYEQTYSYFEKQPAIDSINVIYHINNIGTYAYSGTQFFVEIKNNDVIGGNFKVIFFVENIWGSKTTEEKTQFIPSGALVTVWSQGYEMYGGYSLKSWSYDIIPPTKQILVEKDIKKTGTKIAYKQECKNIQSVTYMTEYKEVTKTVQKSIWDSWFS